MKRHLSNAAVLVSLLLFVALVVLWARSYKRGEAVSVSRSVWPSADTCVHRYASLRIRRGHWVLVWGRTDYDTRRPEGITKIHAVDLPSWRAEYAPGVRWSRFSWKVKPPPEDHFVDVKTRLGFGRRDDPPRTYLGQTYETGAAVAPVWPVAAALALPTAWRVTVAVRRRRRARANACTACGYDLRARPGTDCPECGSPVGAREATG